jgi:hypothetical protein
MTLYLYIFAHESVPNYICVCPWINTYRPMAINYSILDLLIKSLFCKRGREGEKCATAFCVNQSLYSRQRNARESQLKEPTFFNGIHEHSFRGMEASKEGLF